MTQRQEKLIENYVRQKVKKMLKEGNNDLNMGQIRSLKNDLMLLIKKYKMDHGAFINLATDILNGEFD